MTSKNTHQDDAKKPIMDIDPKVLNIQIL